MKILKLSTVTIGGFLGMTLLFSFFNSSVVFSWQAMANIWQFYPGIFGFIAAFAFRHYYHIAGGGIFFAFCLIIPATVLSYYLSLPWGNFFFQPLPIIIAGLFSAFGEGLSAFLYK